MLLDPSCFTLPYDHMLCEALVRGGCNVLLVASRPAYGQGHRQVSYQFQQHFYKATDMIFRRRSSGFLRRYVKGIEHGANMWSLVRLARRLKPDVIHFQWAVVPVIDTRFLGMLRRVAPLVFTVHESLLSSHRRGSDSRLTWVRYAGFLKQFDHFLAHTRHTRDTLVAEMDLPADRISLVPHGLLDYYEDLGSTQQPTSDNVDRAPCHRVLFFGTVSAYKGVDVLIRAVAKLPKPLMARTRLMIAGRPTMPVAPLQQLAMELGVWDRIDWDLRFIGEEEVHSVLKSATIIALPHRHVDQSGVLMAVLPYGKPIVASRVGGFAEILEDGVHGYLVDPGDSAGFAEAMVGILGDSERRQSMSESVSRLANQWPSWDAIGKQTMEIYQDLVAAR